MVVSKNKTSTNIESTAQLLKPMWTPVYNLGLALIVSVIAAITAFALTNNLSDGSTLIAVPVGILAWFAGDILRWRGRFPMRLLLMVPIFVALSCTVSIRFVQKANQRRIAWNSMIEAGASVKFETVNLNGWVQYDEGVFLPEFLETWLGSAVFANSADVSIPVVAFAVDSPESRVLRTMDFDRTPMFDLEIVDGSRNKSKIDLDAFSNLVNSNRVENLEVTLFEPNPETIQALQVIKRPYYLRLSGVLSEKAMRHLPIDSPIQFLVLDLNDPPDRTSWLNFLTATPNCNVVSVGSVSAASFRTIDPDSSLGKFRFSPCTLDDSALQELARLSGSAFVSLQHFRNSPSQASIEALCQSPVSMDIGPLSLNPASVQLLVENETRARLHLRISSIDSVSFQRLVQVKNLKSIELGFELTEEDIQTIASFPKDIELTLGYKTNKSRLLEIEAATKSRN